MLANEVLLPYIHDLTILRDTGIPQHCPLRLVLHFHTVKDNKLVYKSPKALPNLDPPDPTFARSLDQQLWSQADNACQHAVICNDFDEAFRVWSKTAEQFCIKLALEQGHAFARKHRGRGTTPN